MTGLALSFLAGVLPMGFYAWLLYMLDRFEKEPVRLLLGSFAWGAIIASSVAFLVNSLSSLGLLLLTQNEYTTQLTITTLVGPLVEESAKGAAVLLIFLIFPHEFDSPLDGIIYAGITALGFGAAENVWYIYHLGYLPGGLNGLLDLTLIRALVVGWQHPFYSAFIGLGFALSRTGERHPLKGLLPFLGWAAAVFFHFCHNLLVNLLAYQEAYGLRMIWDWTGYLGLILLIILLIRREGNWMGIHLKYEADQGWITPDQYKACRTGWGQSRALLQGMLEGKLKEARHFYQLCGELTHKKRRFERNPYPGQTAKQIKRLQSELALLSKGL